MAIGVPTAGTIVTDATATSVAPTKSCTAGNLVVAVLFGFGGLTFTGPGGSWAFAVGQVNSTNTNAEIWYLPGSANPGGTVNPTWTCTSQACSGVLIEASGVFNTPLVAVASATASLSLTCASGTISGGNATDLAIAAFVERQTTSGTVTFTPGGSFANVASQATLNKAYHGVVDYLLNAGATPSETQTSSTISVANGWSGVIASFKAASTDGDFLGFM